MTNLTILEAFRQTLSATKKYVNNRIDGLASETYVNNAVAGLVDSAPEALNTLNELASALGNDANFSTTVATEIGRKVDRIDGKSLSTNDLTNELKANYDAAYTHSTSAHAPSNAQKNSDILKSEIEAKLTGNITSHTHSQYLTSIPAEYITEAELNAKGYATTSQIPTVPTNVSELNNDANYASETYVNNKIAEASLSGGEVDLSTYQTKTDNTLNTTDKTVVGAINEINETMVIAEEQAGDITVGGISVGGSSEAKDITITDVGGYYEATNVEGALQEAGSQIEDVKNKTNKKIYYFDSVNSMKSYNLKVGEVCETAGYHTANDGGGGKYIVVNSGTADEGSLIALNNNLYAQLIIEDGRVNVKQFGAKGDNTTDDTVAFRKAMDYMQNNVLNDVWGGWDTHKYSLFIPSGVYIISQPDTLTITNSSIFSAGFTILGNGMTNSIIKYTSTNTEEYLCQVGVNNSVGTVGAFLNFKDITIIGNNNNFFAMYAQNGAPQEVYFTNCGFRGLKHNVVIRYGSANANADKFKFFGCNFNIPSGGILFGILDTGISQSVSHNFYGCNVYAEGTCIYLRSAGNISYDGGSCVISDGRFLDIEGHGADISSSIGKLVVQNVKFEFFSNSASDTLIYNNSSLPVVFSKCGFGQMVSSKPTNRMIYLKDSADLCFEQCNIPEPIKTTIENPGNATQKALLKFDSCILSPLQSYNITNTLTSNTMNVQYLGDVIAENCYYNIGNPKEKRLVNFHSNVKRGFNIINPKLKIVFLRDTGWGNTDYMAASNVVYLPKSSTLKKVRLHLTTQNKTSTFTITKGTTEIFSQEVNMSKLTDADRIIETNELMLEFNSDNIEENKLTITSSAGAIKGFIEVQYY